MEINEKMIVESAYNIGQASNGAFNYEGLRAMPIELLYHLLTIHNKRNARASGAEAD